MFKEGAERSQKQKAAVDSEQRIRVKQKQLHAKYMEEQEKLKAKYDEDNDKLELELASINKYLED